MNLKKMIALTSFIIFLIGSLVFNINAYAEGKNDLINLSGSLYYDNIIKKFKNDVLQLELGKNDTIKVVIDIKLLDRSNIDKIADNLFLITQITRKDKGTKMEYIDIKSDDLREVIYKDKTIKAYIDFYARKDEVSKNLDITFFESGEYIIDFFVCKKGESEGKNIHSAGGSSRRNKHTEREKAKIFGYPNHKYQDIYGHWAHDCIKALLNRGIIKGYPDNTIRPENFITRAEMAVVISNSLFLELEISELIFKDKIPVWAENAIAKLSKLDIFKGYPDGRFHPGKYITREQAVAVLVRAFCKKDKSTKNLFKDTQDISPWAREYINTGVNKKILTGYPDNTIRPKSPITRAEVFTIICKLLGYHEGHDLSQ